MDLTKQIVFNGLTLNGALSPVAGTPLSGYAVDQVEPSAVDVRGYSAPRALKDGLDASDVYLGGRRFSAIVTVYGSTKGDFWDKTQDVLSAFSPTLAYTADSAALGFLAWDFYQPTADTTNWPTATYPNGIPLRYYVRSTTPPLYTIRRDEDGGLAGSGLSKQFRVTMEAKNPRKVNQSTSSVAGSAATATNKGDYTAWATVTVSVSSQTDGGTVILTVGANSLSVSVASSTATTTIVLDGEEGTLKRNGTLSMGLLTGGSLDSLLLSSGATAVSFSKTGLAAVTPTVTWVWRDSFA